MKKVAKISLVIGISIIIIFAFILGFTVYLFDGGYYSRKVDSMMAFKTAMRKEFDDLKGRTVFVFELDEIGEATSFTVAGWEDGKGCEKSHVRFEWYGCSGIVMVNEIKCEVGISVSSYAEERTGEDVLLDGITAKICQEQWVDFLVYFILEDLHYQIRLTFEEETAKTMGNARQVAEAIIKTRTEVGALRG